MKDLLNNVQEIKRKFLVKNLPDLSKLQKEQFERYFLVCEKGIELRVQKINERFEIERLVKREDSSREIQVLTISEIEFSKLIPFTKDFIKRDVYLFSKNIEICVYHDRFEGLIRIEVSFDFEENAISYKPLDWFGKEITNTPLWRDSSLLNLSTEEFKQLLSL